MTILIAAVTLASIFAYLTSPVAGFAITLFIVFMLGMRAQGSRLEKLLTMLMVTMPLYALPLLPGLHYVASWSTGLLLALTAMLAARVGRISPWVLFLSLPLLTVSVLTGVFTADGVETWYYVAQALLFIIPPLLAYESRNWIRATIGNDARLRLLSVLAGVQLALALGVLIQSQVHSRFGLPLGSISFFVNRVTYDLTVNAHSVLSGLLAVGIVLAPTLWRHGCWKTAIFLAVTSGGAIVVNSSRTGLVVGIAVLGLALLFPPAGARRVGARLAIIPAGLLAWWMYDSFLASSRGAGMTDFLDDNGRWETFTHGFDRLMTDLQTALVGIGYADNAFQAPHNFAIETLVRSGFVVGTCMLLFVIGLLWYLRGSEWQYPVMALLAGSMLYAGFYAVKPAVVVTTVMIILCAAGRRAHDVSAETPGRLLTTR